MTSSLAANQIIPTRQELLDVWKEREGVSFRELGRRLGLSGVQVSNLCSADRISTHRHAQLVAAGVPEYLLPRAEDVRPGPKPRPASVHEEFEAAYKG